MDDFGTHAGINISHFKFQILEVVKEKEKFEINKYKKDCIINGFDDIDYLINRLSFIEKFEQNYVSK